MRKPLTPLFIIVILMIFSVGKTKAQSAIIDEHFKAINNHDVKAIVATYTPDAEVRSPNWEGVKAGPDSIATIFSRYFKSTPDLTYSITNMINAKNAATVEYTFSGTLNNPEGGTPDYMKGKKYTLQGCVVLILKDNKIVKETNYFDQVAFLRQVGFFDQNH